MDGHLASSQTDKNRVTFDYYGQGFFSTFEFIEKGGERMLFLHISVDDWNKSTLKALREDLEQVLDMCMELGVETVSFVLPKNMSTKFHSLVRPLDYEFIEGENIIGGWYTDGH